MLAVVLTHVIVLVLLSRAARQLRGSWGGAPRAWRLLAFSGIPLALCGWILVLRRWMPTPGPYLADTRYPFGSLLDAYVVSFGFTWIAFGLLFTALALVGPVDRRTFSLLRTAWLLCWLPHGVIGVGFLLAGQNAASVERYRTWASDPIGAIILLADAFLLLLHFCSSMVGFVLVARDLSRSGVAATRGA